MQLLEYPQTEEAREFEQKKASTQAQADQLRQRKPIPYAMTATLVLSYVLALAWGLISQGALGLVTATVAVIPVAFLVGISYLMSSPASVTKWERYAVFAWGAVGSILLTFLIISIRTALVGAASEEEAVIMQAAVVEEISKAAVLFFMLWFMRDRLRTPMVGLTLGFLAGAGFAFTENILYFGNAFISGGWEGFWQTFVMRAIVSFFLHSIATMFTGLMIGYVVSRGKKMKWFPRFIWPSVGLLAAMSIHGMWNGLAMLNTVQGQWTVMYAFFWLPFLAILAITVVVLRKQEALSKASDLQRTLQAGYIGHEQITLIESRPDRKAWAKGRKLQNRALYTWQNKMSKSFFWADQKINVKPKAEARYTKRELKRFNQALVAAKNV